MRQILTIVLLCAGVLSQLSAQDVSSRFRKRYINFSFANQKFTPAENVFESGYKLKSNYGAAITVGKTFPLHKKPLANMIRIGLDATWFDLNFTNYRLLYRYDDGFSGDYGDYYDDYYGEEEETQNFYQAEIAMQVGPSVSINPISKLSVHAYFRYAPGYSVLYNGDNVYGGYASYFVGGACVSYGVIGLGIESRFGSCKYKVFGGDDGDDDYYYGDEGMGDDVSPSSSLKSKLSGFRCYISFRL